MEQYNPKKLEAKWRKKWILENRWQVDIDKAKKPYYNLMMFPYPSAEGLHVGNLYAFTGSDIYGRYMRMHGYDVFEPIGFDAFGIHSENFAIKKNVHPRELIKKSTDNFQRQLERAGNIYSWDNLVNTTDPKYYKWTQWLFLQLYNAGLAYHKEAPVQWCPGCVTVLANEQVISGKCERCESLVEIKKLRQWFLKITEYADRLLENLEEIDWSERTKIAQYNWIGKSIGYRLKFKVQSSKFKVYKNIETFTTRPDTLFGATYIVLAPEHSMVKELKESIENWPEVEKYISKVKNKSQSERTREEKDKTGVELKGILAQNPASKEEIPIWIADYVLADYGTGAIMAVPAHDVRDFEFAKKYHLSIKQVIVAKGKKEEKELKEAYEGEGFLVNSGSFDSLTSEEAKDKIGEHVEGDLGVHYHIRDWLISRQRYWGPPIPIIYCSSCRNSQVDNAESQIEGVDWTVIDGVEVAIVPIVEKDLPVELPYVEDFRPKGRGKSPLAFFEEFVNVKCPKCGEDARRETDVSDTFLDSSWYFLRYPSIDRNDKPFDRSITKKWLPVDMYIGGQEHAVLHLMYARFITMFLYDQKRITFQEPFKKFRTHGLLIKDGAKMSKSKGNVINPDEYFDAWGADTVRMYLMFLSPFEDTADWRDEGIRGIHRFLGRVWGLVSDGIKTKGVRPSELERERHKTIKKVTEDIERMNYNTAISSLMSYLNTLYENQHTKEDIKILLILLAPFAPYITEELWERLVDKGSVHNQAWPEFNKKIVKEDIITIPVQINGKLKSEIEISVDTKEDELKKLVLENVKIKEYLGDKKPKKIIVVKNKIINIVL